MCKLIQFIEILLESDNQTTKYLQFDCLASEGQDTPALSAMQDGRLHGGAAENCSPAAMRAGERKRI